ncbi:hypothetical protein BerOc1_00790 [Pseudodesulfovibrio hydrargyri]|uniref:Uncharacterized protein n=1 Tax=Pseudodesulfovibrio hydrargyri TaxID=2125990 RepID=A0A1J5N9L1_9BACT|nr:hypothetical protein [Pseudodesulfovibrio hydrargyri]OIQ52315.1 hypothetical protein BerOc1_00790 [Pseudodesulfovibrio hydrargyri]
MFKKVLYICLWLCVLSGAASTATPPDAAPTITAAQATLNP